MSTVFNASGVGILKSASFDLKICAGEKLPLLLKPHTTLSSGLKDKLCSYQFLPQFLENGSNLVNELFEAEPVAGLFVCLFLFIFLD